MSRCTEESVTLVEVNIDILEISFQHVNFIICSQLSSEDFFKKPVTIIVRTVRINIRIEKFTKIIPARVPRGRQRHWKTFLFYGLVLGNIWSSEVHVYEPKLLWVLGESCGDWKGSECNKDAEFDHFYVDATGTTIVWGLNRELRPAQLRWFFPAGSC